MPYVLFATELTGLPPAEITIAVILSDKGYATAAIGKWHLGWPEPHRAQRHGLDFLRYTFVLGGHLQTTSSRAQRREATIRCHILNRMAELGKPNFDAVAS